jgi:hypothetical protein
VQRYWYYERCEPEHDPYSNLSPLFLTRNDTSLNYENASNLSLSEELEYVICLNDPSVLAARLSKPGRPRRGARAITQNDKNEALEFAMPEASLATIDTLIRHGADLTVLSYEKAIARNEVALLELFVTWGWDINLIEQGHCPVS